MNTGPRPETYADLPAWRREPTILATVNYQYVTKAPEFFTGLLQRLHRADDYGYDRGAVRTRHRYGAVEFYMDLTPTEKQEALTSAQTTWDYLEKQRQEQEASER